MTLHSNSHPNSDHNGLTMYQYLVKIVPTIYESLDGTVINTNQFSVTEHTRNMPPGEKSGLPGTSPPLGLYAYYNPPDQCEPTNGKVFL